MTLAEITSTLRPEMTALNAIIAEALGTATPLMNDIVAHYLLTKGKQIRPVMVMLCARMFGPVGEPALHAAAALELLHNASLIHDDVVDDTKRRRGRQTINAVWDNHIAVLVGDFFVSAALAEAVRTGSIEIVQALSDLGKELSLGEIHQICNARSRHFRIDEYYTAIRKKTASLFMQCAEVGARAEQADPRLSAPLTRYAEMLGLCFQIRDDIFDYFPSEATGKPSGNDLREGKVTLPLLHALQAAPALEAEAMKRLLQSEELDPAQIRTLIEFAHRNGGIEFAYAEMERIHAEALPLLGSYPDTATRHALQELFAYIISRDK